MVIYIIRHGEKTRYGTNLTPRGKKQAKFLGKRFKNKEISKIYSSNLGRVKETTDIVKKYVKAEVTHVDSLNEVADFLNNKSKSYKKDLSKVRKFYNKIIKERGNILLISSGNVNRLIYSFLLKIEPKKSLFLQNPTGVAQIEKVGGKLVITSTNDLSHLPEKLKIKQGY